MVDSMFDYIYGFLYYKYKSFFDSVWGGEGGEVKGGEGVFIYRCDGVSHVFPLHGSLFDCSRDHSRDCSRDLGLCCVWVEYISSGVRRISPVNKR